MGICIVYNIDSMSLKILNIPLKKKKKVENNSFKLHLMEVKIVT